MTEPSRIRFSYAYGILGVLIGLGGFIFASDKDAENWFWIAFAFFGGLYVIVRTWMADETR
jgi:hypothetical protein